MPRRNAPGNTPVDALINKYFHSFNDSGDISWQGQVISKLSDDYYLVQLFDWVMGAESNMHVVCLSDMLKWNIYHTDDDMRSFAERRSR